jgi:hypothetical protein
VENEVVLHSWNNLAVAFTEKQIKKISQIDKEITAIINYWWNILLLIIQ